MTEQHVLLSGIVGSTAYGLAHEGSDVDQLGVFATPTEDLLGLTPPKDTIVTTGPDVTMHEAGKYCRLALKCNPTVMELMWLPDVLLTTVTPLGYALTDIREAFLSAPYVRNAYFGYAVQQFKKLEARGDGTFGPDLAKRTAKHARHMYRLLVQGHGLWSTGRLTIGISNPSDVLDFGEEVASGDLRLAREVLASYEDQFNAAQTVLPGEPETETVEAWLLTVRREFYRER